MADVGVRASRRTTAERERRFAAAYLKLKGNGIEAAKAAGYSGSRPNLATTACRLLGRASVRALLEQHGQAVEERMGMAVEAILDRIAMQATADLGDFLRVVKPAEARLVVQAIGAVEGADEAKAVARALRGNGVVVDVEQGIKAGRSATLKSYRVKQTPEGAPDISIEVRDPMPALTLLAKIRGLTREQPPAPPPQNITLNMILGEMPLEVLRVLRDQLDAAAQRRRAIPAVIVP